MRFFDLHLHARSPMLLVACLLATAPGVGCSSEDPPKAPPIGGTPTPVLGEVDVKRYDLSGEYDWEQGRLLATVRVTLSPTEDGTTAIQLDSAVTEVKEVRLSGRGALSFSTDAAAEKLRVDLAELGGLASGAEITLEIDYEAEPSDSLFPVSDRLGDPLDVRTVFTMSEPLGAERWMPCHNTPSDRALFSVEMRMDDAEKMIANGDLIADEAAEDGGRRMRYETAYTLPTYLMAFAIGDFEVKSTTHGGLPVSIWHRRGLQGSFDAVLGDMVGMLERFEELLGPYPFEKYAVVHLPVLPAGGIENASITFQKEGNGLEPTLGDLTLNAHELAHQWFGDLVTIESWDDLWIKEGMATLLELEGVRVHTDEAGPMTLNGNDLGFWEGEAIRDTSLAPNDKYTSGPYSRAAWLLTQIRSLVGEEVFWSTLRGVLDEHREGAIGTEAFLGAFAEALGPEATERARQAVDAKGVPSLQMAPAPSGGVTMTLHDPHGTLVAPFDLAWVAADGSTQTQTATVDEPLEVTPPQSGEFLILDPMDRHPTWDLFLSDEESMAAFQTDVIPLLAPTTPEQVARFLEIGAAHQEEVLWVSLLDLEPETFQEIVAGLDSEWVRAMPVASACMIASDPELDPQQAAAWESVLDEALRVPPAPFSLPLVQNGGYGACTMFDAVTEFAADWALLETGLPSGEIPFTRLAFLSAFKIPAPLAMATWGSVATRASSPRARWLATMHLRSYIGELAPADLPAWRAFFVDLLSATENTDVLGQAIRAVVASMAPTAAENADALAGLGVVLRSPWTRPLHPRAVCAAHTLTQGDAAAWGAFVEGLDDVSIEPSAAEILADPSLCQ